LGRIGSWPTICGDDVVFSFEVLKANSPQYAFYYHNVTKAEVVGPREPRTRTPRRRR
jgi:hypothetical protein